MDDILTLDLSDFLDGDFTENQKNKYNEFIGKLRESFNKNSQANGNFLVDVVSKQENAVLALRKNDLYLVGSGSNKDNLVFPKSEKSLSYINESLNFNSPGLLTGLKELREGKLVKEANGRLVIGNGTRLFANLISEAARFGVIRENFARRLATPKGDIDVNKFLLLVQDWEKLYKAVNKVNGTEPVNKKLVGLGDELVEYGGDGVKYNKYCQCKNGILGINLP
ncbi:hypothetical protein NIES2101_09425 [Calothrix sp. HK-06]|nr:hypothetical protein NIES2101_09425 [Calothrix sp. HK-06]